MKRVQCIKAKKCKRVFIAKKPHLRAGVESGVVRYCTEWHSCCGRNSIWIVACVRETGIQSAWCASGKVNAYEKTGKDELLVDIANLALLEFVEGVHPNKHFKSADDVNHVKEKGES